MNEKRLKNVKVEKDDLDPLLLLSIYNLLKTEAKSEFNSGILTLKIKKAWRILIEEMFNVENTNLFKKLLSKMVQDDMITIDQKSNKIIFKK